jgi:hypothetical protein
MALEADIVVADWERTAGGKRDVSIERGGVVVEGE